MIPEDHSYAIGELNGVNVVASSNIVAPTNRFSDTIKTSVPRRYSPSDEHTGAGHGWPMNSSSMTFEN